MIPSVFKLAIVFAMATGCGEAAAACIAMPGPGQSIPLTSVVNLALGGSSAVFTGKVTAIEYVPAPDEGAGDLDAQVVRVAAHSWWKGAESEEVTLHTANHRNAAGDTSTEAHEYRYEVGKSYLIYAGAFRGALYANVCTRTKAIEDAADDIAMLDALKAEAEVPSQ